MLRLVTVAGTHSGCQLSERPWHLELMKQDGPSGLIGLTVYEVDRMSRPQPAIDTTS